MFHMHTSGVLEDTAGHLGWGKGSMFHRGRMKMGPGKSLSEERSPSEEAYITTRGSMHEFVHLERRCGPRGYSGHRDGSRPILRAPTQPLLS